MGTSKYINLCRITKCNVVDNYLLFRLLVVICGITFRVFKREGELTMIPF